MNSLERYTNLLAGQPVDILPRMPILMQYAAEYIGSNYGAFAADHRVLVEANLRCVSDFDFDQVSAISDPYRETQGFGAEIVFVRDATPRCPHPPLEQTKDLALLQEPDPLRSPRMRDRIDALRAFQTQVGGTYSILGWVEGPAAEAADLRGVGQFMVDLLDDREFAATLMDRCVEVGIAFGLAQLKAGADTIGIGDAVCSQVSPRVYRQLIQPRQKRLIQALKDAGALVRLHICGNITHLLPGIAELPIDILDVDHMVDIVAVRRAVGPRVTIAGQIDPVNGIRFGTPAAIRAAIHETYRLVGNPYMVTAGCEIPSGTPVENLKALCEPVAYVA